MKTPLFGKANLEQVCKVPGYTLPYNLLVDLMKKKEDKILSQSDFMNLPLNERRRIMSEQAQKMIFDYEQNTEELLEWQAGEFNDGISAVGTGSVQRDGQNP